MKRPISIILMLLANLLILVHAVVPHHHHNKAFTAIVNVLDNDTRDLFSHEHVFLPYHELGVLFISSQSVEIFKSKMLLKAVAELGEDSIVGCLSERFVKDELHVALELSHFLYLQLVFALLQ